MKKILNVCLLNERLKDCQQGTDNIEENLVMKSLRMVYQLNNLPEIGIHNQTIVHYGSEL